MKSKIKTSLRISALLTLCVLPQVAVAGPPLICHAIDIGQAKSLPWTSSTWNVSGNETYDINHLVDDTLALLNADTPALVRMETLRRASLYANNNMTVAKQLLFKIRTRALDAEAKGSEGAFATFDYGYLVETYKQAKWAPGRRPGNSGDGSIADLATNFDGYTAVEKAIKLRGDDPEMEFAAALITLGGSSYPGHQEHLQRALDGANADPLLARNLSTHFIGEKTETMAEMFKKRQAEN